MFKDRECRGVDLRIRGQQFEGVVLVAQVEAVSCGYLARGF